MSLALCVHIYIILCVICTTNLQPLQNSDYVYSCGEFFLVKIQHLRNRNALFIFVIMFLPYTQAIIGARCIMSSRDLGERFQKPTLTMLHFLVVSYIYVISFLNKRYKHQIF